MEENSSTEVVVQEKEIPQIQPPTSFVIRSRVSRLARIFSNLVIALGIISFLMMLGWIFVPMLVIVVFMLVLVAEIAIVFFTFGLVFLVPNNIAVRLWDFIGNIFSHGLVFEQIMTLLTNIARTMCFIGVALSILSTVMLTVFKVNNKAARIAINIICGILMVIALLIFYFVEVGHV